LVDRYDEIGFNLFIRDKSKATRTEDETDQSRKEKWPMHAITFSYSSW